MRVRGWYLPAWSWVSFRVLGWLAPPSAACESSILGPSRASSPMPRPLGFFVTIPRLSFIGTARGQLRVPRASPGAVPCRGRASTSQEVGQPATAFGPVAQPGVTVEVAACAGRPLAAAPVGRHGARLVGRAVRIVLAPDDERGKRQLLPH